MVEVKETPLQRERRIREDWKKNDTFQKSILSREGNETFVFYEGPPTANGMPHAGHALGRTIKDFVARYKTMAGYQVIRKAGWDTHGLPVELGVEKQLQIRGKDEIENYGVERFIEKCKESVFAYEKEWRQFTDLLGYWVDMGNPYITLENSYIESVWNILSTIHQKGFLYKGHRVVPYCPDCETSLSSHEVAQGYKDVTDLSVTAKFRVVGSENEYLLGWTTTPWTLPANVAIAVNPDMNYAKVKRDAEVFIVAESLVETVMGESYEIVSVLKGKDLTGISYEAPFDFISISKGHQVVAADFVTDTSGTGLVHIAPAYGEDDYHVVKNNEFDFVNVVDSKGCYKENVTPLAGRFVKDCDVEIIKMLSKSNLLFEKQKYEHSYPHCWRCDSPLIYYAMESWFIKTTAVKERMQSINQSVEWFPHHIKDGRFGKFLDNMVDWNIGRNRYWGTPLNIWECKECGNELAPNSIEELQRHATSVVPNDIELHKPYVDEVHLKCSCGSTMKRTSEVIDVWFDSGSMPFAQYHYPFENKELFNKQFPADVIAEGVDQTRGWFYSLLAVSALLTGKTPYKRVLSLGHILDENGQKMSKSKGNALNPVDLIEEFGADALRWALLADSAPWNNKRFSKQIVSQAKSKIIDTLLNVHSFYSMYAKIDQFDPSVDLGGTRLILDNWILSRLNTVTGEVRKSLDAYDFTGGARTISSFVEELSNWYVRRSRQRFWSSGMSEDKKAAFSTLYEVLVRVSQLIAPYTPFIAEDIYSDLKKSSVHLSNYPKPDDKLINKELEKDMNGVLQVVELTRSVRNTVGIKTKQPLANLYVLSSKQSAISNLNSYASIIKDETNVKQVHFSDDHSGLLQYNLKLNFPVAGPKLGKVVGEVQKKVNNFSREEINALLENGHVKMTLKNGQLIKLDEEDFIVQKIAKEGFSHAESESYLVILETILNKELKEEGMIREIIRAVQTYRKELNLPVDLRINLYMSIAPEMQEMLMRYDSLLRSNLILNSIFFKEVAGMKSFKVEGEDLGLFIEK
ncbi:isoleucine--tRNA ligase [Domibacillus aminovorans]|uniref:isoleucine--tRNA ligase n=1 Tax=Domibacillus aminovorans TaxID=29332 RepID=UPI003CC7F547